MADYHPGGDWVVVSTSGFQRLTFWPLRHALPSAVPGYTPLARPVAFSPDGRWLATGWADGKLRLWPMPGTGGRELKGLGSPPPPNLWTRIVFDPRGRYLFAVGMNDQAWIVPLDGSPPRSLPAYSGGTLLYAAAVSPSGRLVATAFSYGEGEKTLRVHDVEAGTTQVFPLPAPAPAAVASSPSKRTGYEGGVVALAFADESTLYSGGDGGVRRWKLPAGSHETVWATDPGVIAGPVALGGSGPTALLGVWKSGTSYCLSVRTLDVVTGRSAASEGHGECPDGPQSLDLAGSGDVAVFGDRDGTIRVGPKDGGARHLLLGHEGVVDTVAISPDRRWVASTGEDDTLRLWPMPDLTKPPLHTLPRAELIAKLHSLTNLRAVRDASSPTGGKIDLAPFPGWRDVPTW